MNTSEKTDKQKLFSRSAAITPEIAALLESIPRYKELGGSVPRLLYAGTCPRCRFLSACVSVFSFARIRRIPLDQPEWRELYARLPEARGYPVLIVNNRMIFGGTVFLRVPLLVVRSWFPWKAYNHGGPRDSGLKAGEDNGRHTQNA